MKKIFTLTAGILLAANSFAVTEYKGFTTGVPETFGEYGGEYKGANAEYNFDATQYDYVWMKYSDLTGTIKFAVDYCDWKSTESWGETFYEQNISSSEKSGILAIKIDKKSIIKNGDKKENGQYIGDVYAKHMRQLTIQGTAKTNTITVEGVYFGTAEEYKQAAGLSTNNHVLKISSAQTSAHNYDYQLFINTNLPYAADAVYTLSGKVKASADKKLSIWTNDGVAYPNTKTQYGNPQIAATTAWADFSVQLAPAKLEGDVTFDIKQLALPLGDFAGDIEFDDLKITDAAGNVITAADFEIDMDGISSAGSIGVKMVEEETVTTGINNAKAAIAAPKEGQAFNLNGQAVNQDAKGVIILNGKKIVNK